MSPVLEIRDYALDYVTQGGTQRVLQAIDLAIEAGEVVGLVGESGSGKTSLAWAIMRHLPANAREAPAGRIRLGDTDLRAASAKSLETIRGRRMSMVFQDPSTALNPTLTIGRQVTEVLVRHRGLSEREAWREAIQALEHVDLRQPEALMRRYPHQHRAARSSVSASPPPSPAGPNLSSSTNPRPRSTSSPGRASWNCSAACARRPASPRSISRMILRWSRESPIGSPSWRRARSSRKRPAPRSSAIRCTTIRAGSWPRRLGRSGGWSPIRSRTTNF
jgi:predicted ABC-type transport system involved in lysophospholipase L1 biosynthesis ATPase subunit